MSNQAQAAWKIIADQLGAMLGLISESNPNDAAVVETITMTSEHLLKFETALDADAIRASGTVTETFDRSDPVYGVAADSCFAGISKLCGVKVWYRTRAERTMFDSIQQHRLVAMLGTPLDVGYAAGIYNLIDDTINEQVEQLRTTPNFTKAKHKGTVISTFQTAMAARINKGLEQLATSASTLQTKDKQLLLSVKIDMIKQAVEQSNLRLQQRTPLKLAVNHG